MKIILLIYKIKSILRNIIYHILFIGKINMPMYGISIPDIKIRVYKNGKIILGNKFSSRSNVILNVNSNGLLNIGDNVFINDNSIINVRSNVIIGDNTIIGQNVLIYDHDHCYNNIDRMRDLFIMEDVIIGKNVWIGSNAIILKGSVINDNSVIAAGSIVNGVIESNILYKNQIEKKYRKIQHISDDN